MRRGKTVSLLTTFITLLLFLVTYFDPFLAISLVCEHNGLEKIARIHDLFSALISSPCVAWTQSSAFFFSMFSC